MSDATPSNELCGCAVASEQIAFRRDECPYCENRRLKRDVEHLRRELGESERYIEGREQHIADMAKGGEVIIAECDRLRAALDWYRTARPLDLNNEGAILEYQRVARAALNGLPFETGELQPVAWRYVVDSAYEPHPRWAFSDEEPPSNLKPEPLYTRAQLNGTGDA